MGEKELLLLNQILTNLRLRSGSKVEPQKQKKLNKLLKQILRQQQNLSKYLKDGHTDYQEKFWN